MHDDDCEDEDDAEQDGEEKIIIKGSQTPRRRKAKTPVSFQRKIKAATKRQLKHGQRVKESG